MLLALFFDRQNNPKRDSSLQVSFKKLEIIYFDLKIYLVIIYRFYADFIGYKLVICGLSADLSKLYQNYFLFFIFYFLKIKIMLKNKK